MESKELITKLEPNLQAVKTALFDKGITYAELASKIQMSEATVNNKLSGRTKFYLDEFYDLSQVVQANMMDLVTITPR